MDPATSAVGKEPVLLLLAPALHPRTDLRTGHLLFPQPAIAQVHKALQRGRVGRSCMLSQSMFSLLRSRTLCWPRGSASAGSNARPHTQAHKRRCVPCHVQGRPLWADDQGPESWACRHLRAGQPGRKGRWGGGDGDSVHSADTPEQGRGAGWPQVPQLLDFFTGAGFARAPAVASTRRPHRTGDAPSQQTEQVTPRAEPRGEPCACVRPILWQVGDLPFGPRGSCTCCGNLAVPVSFTTTCVINCRFHCRLKTL